MTRTANNYFGIKCNGWTGKTYNINTGEYTPSGEAYTENACFRAYDTVEDSMKDYVKFLQTNPRYEKAGVFAADSVKTQAEALKRAGYATDPAYASKIESIYNGIKSYMDKYSEYGLAGITKSFLNNPISFSKRNWIPIVALLGIGAVTATTIYLVRKNK